MSLMTTDSDVQQAMIEAVHQLCRHMTANSLRKLRDIIDSILETL